MSDLTPGQLADIEADKVARRIVGDLPATTKRRRVDDIPPSKLVENLHYRHYRKKAYNRGADTEGLPTGGGY